MLGVFCKSSNLDVNVCVCVCVCVLTYEIEFCRIFPPICKYNNNNKSNEKRESFMSHTHTFVAKFLYACLFGHKKRIA